MHKTNNECNKKSNLTPSDADEEEAMCGLIHNDCHRSIINKFFEFYKFNEKEAVETNPLFIDKDNLIESFKNDIIAYINHKNNNNNYNNFNNNENACESKYKFKYYQGMNDLIIFFILLQKTSKMYLKKYSPKAENKNGSQFKINDEIISYMKNENNKFDLHKFLDFVFHRNFKPFCFIKLNYSHHNAFDNSKLLVDFCGKNQHKKENSNALKMKKILPTVVKYVEIIDPKVKRRLFDLTKIDPFYSLGWILTWFTHNNENIFKNLRIIDYLLFSEINTIFYLVAVVHKIIKTIKKISRFLILFYFCCHKFFKISYKLFVIFKFYF